jgi:hypothetical protein
VLTKSSAVLVEENEEWIKTGRYISNAFMAKLNNLPVRVLARRELGLEDAA